MTLLQVQIYILGIAISLIRENYRLRYYFVSDEIKEEYKEDKEKLAQLSHLRDMYAFIKYSLKLDDRGVILAISFVMSLGWPFILINDTINGAKKLLGIKQGESNGK